MNNLNVQKIVQFFGGPSKLSRRINDTPGLSTKTKTIEMWIYRKSIPGKWISVLARFAKEDGREFDLTDFEATEETPDFLE